MKTTFGRKVADICTAGLTASYERRQAVAFTTTLHFYEIGVTIPRANTGMLKFYKHTNTLSLMTTFPKIPTLSAVALNYLVFIDVFMSNLWICLAVMILVSAFVLFVVKNPDSESFSFMNSFALVTVIIIQRDFGIEKNRVSTRYDIMDIRVQVKKIYAF